MTSMTCNPSTKEILTTTTTKYINGLQVPSDQHFPPPKPDLSIYQPPKSKVAQFFWRRWMWFEATFVFSMLEPWEKVMLCTPPFSIALPCELTVHLVMMAFIFTSLFFTGMVKYFPPHVTLMRRRAMYYLLGQEGDEYLLWQWLGIGVGNALRTEL
ncbi:hypothetical protein EYR38_001461 [Pleurotus pulmonarius]|nr:hypothetical protein EYR38_001461 [Pleurotus pulmonarius]